MPENLLSLQGSSEWRNSLLSKNLPPYSVQGVLAPNPQNLGVESELSVTNIVNSPDVSFDIFDESQQATIYNKYQGQKLDGAELITIPTNPTEFEVIGSGGGLVQNNGQKGEYSPKITNLDIINEASINAISVLNKFTPEDEYSNLFIVTTNILAKGLFTGVYPTFIQQTYNLIDIINQDTVDNLLKDGNGSDSYLQQLGLKFLKNSFQQRIDSEIERNTIGRVNLDAFQNPWEVALLATGQEPLVQKNWSITVPDGIFDQAKYLIQKVAGTIIPTSPIEGSYFLEPDNRKLSLKQLLDQSFNTIYKPADPKNNPSKKFLNNTGSGQKSVLFQTLGYNVFKPDYDTNRTQIGVVIDNLFNRDNSLTNFYIGGSVTDPTYLDTPQSQSPVDYLGRQTSSVVLGPDIVAKEYEYKNFDGTDITGGISQIDFGLRNRNLDDGGFLDGGMVWTQKPTVNVGGVAKKEYGDNPEVGKNVGTSKDGGADYNQFGSNPLFNGLSTQSSSLYFKGGSILDETQRLIDAAPTSGKNRLKHAGNAINQISKVFDDGYKQLTKGSKVKTFIRTSTGQVIGQEYCRIFSKDRPYYYRQNLQQTIATGNNSDINGNIRKSSYSVLDSTSNLNIVPNKGVDSTNIRDGRVKKYMFSIENLSWRNTSEFENLPECEKGGNGGRVMWFPPYNLTFDESSSPSFNATTFLGRPEPIYTYTNTKRGGSLSWSIIVDHPSVLNLIVNRELSNISDDSTVKQIVDSFFAGCQKYDLYDLAKKFNTVPFSDLQKLYEEVIGGNKTSIEQKQQAFNGIGTSSNNLPTTENNVILQNDPDGYGFYFDDVTETGSDIQNTKYDILYSTYTSSTRKNIYVTQIPEQSQQITNFFDEVIIQNFDFLKNNFIPEIIQILENKTAKIKILVRGTRYFGTNNYDYLSQQRLSSIVLWFKSVDLGKLSQYIDSKDLTFELSQTYAETTILNGLGQIDCLTALPQGEQIYSTTAMACRALKLKVTLTPNQPDSQSTNNIPSPANTQGTKPKEEPSIENKSSSVSKFLLRKLLSECDYFTALKSDDTMAFDTIRKKIKHFNPAFHSMTPEGLNARLTFLNQCVRPGRTIPVKTEDGTSVVVDSFNTNFGTPPILILRVGDFFNTKIVPNNLSIKYEGLDLNPQGIGVQPMIANITLSFDIIGGMGLKEPVERLQNSLSFNYYANTEMYDDRAEITEDVSAIDTELIQALEKKQNENNTSQLGNAGGGFLGVIKSSTTVNNITSGQIQYKSFFNNLIGETKKYYTETTNKVLDIVNVYNYGILSQISTSRNYTDGYLNNLKFPQTNSLKIFGKPPGWQQYITNVGNAIIQDITNETNPIISALSAYTITDNNKNKIKTNLQNLVNEKINVGYDALQQKIEELSTIQTNYYQFLRKMDFICFSGDGKINADGTPTVYLLSGTTENDYNTLNQLSSDYNIIWTNLKEFYETSVNNGIFVDNMTGGTTFSASTIPLENEYDNRFYTIFSDSIIPTEKRETFIDSLMLNVSNLFGIRNNLEEIVNTLAQKYNNEKLFKNNEFLNYLQSSDYTQFSNYNPFDFNDGVSLNTRERVMNFSDQGVGQQYYEEIKNIYKTVNTNQNSQTYLGKKTFY